MRLLVAVSVLLSFTRDFTVAQHYYQGLMDYLENRMLAIEDRMELWNGQAYHYHTELKDFRRLASDVMDRLAKDHLSLGQDLEGSKVRVSRVEREMDYVESQTTPRACANVADQVFEQGAWSLEEGREEEEDEEVEEDDAWVEVNSRVSDCVELLSNIRSVKILKRAGSPKGMWARDPKSSKVYVFNGTTGDTIYEFNSVLNFTISTGFNRVRPIRLPSLWSGSGSAVYNSYIYYIREGAEAELQVVKYDLLKNSVRDTAIFPVDSRSPVYKLNPETVVDLAADDQGVWAMYAAGNSEPTITLAKMDPGSLDIEQMWDTKCPRENAEAAFVVCGTVYVVYNTVLASRSRVQCVFDVNDMVVSQEAPLLYFPRRYGAHASLKYNPEEKQLYAWDDGYQIIYRLTMKKKLLV